MSRLVGTVAALRRYPIKSMLGEQLGELPVTAGGADGDRTLALLDVETGRVATAKQPRLWRALLRFSASRDGDTVWITLPDGRSVEAGDADIDAVLSEVLGRAVRLSGTRPAGAVVERSAPEDVLEQGVDADVSFATLEIAQGTPGATFVDHSPLHLITTATLARIGAEALRYRPNVVVDTPSGVPFGENAWLGREFAVGEVRLRATLPTPRCAVPTLEHGDLPRAPHAVRVPMADNRVEVEGFGVLPCAGLYAEVLTAGRIREGDEVTLH
ncbi:MAG: MOSC N-terminal beta barrel domain-containing protein [Pseudonocardia sp.]|nr:MOSC N-terminal beta barrel domain-containing protein [Pseudonocardia sp.]